MPRPYTRHNLLALHLRWRLPKLPAARGVLVSARYRLLAFHTAVGHALDEVAREEGEYQQHRYRVEHRACQDVVEELYPLAPLEKAQPDRYCKPLRSIEQHQGVEEVVPCPLELDDGEGG